MPIIAKIYLSIMFLSLFIGIILIICGIPNHRKKILNIGYAIFMFGIALFFGGVMALCLYVIWVGGSF